MDQSLTRRLLNTGVIIFSFLTIIFGLLSILNVSNWLFRIFSQGFLGMTFVFNGIREIAYKNKKKSGISLITVSIFLFWVMFFTIYVAFKIDVF